MLSHFMVLGYKYKVPCYMQNFSGTKNQAMLNLETSLKSNTIFFALKTEISKWSNRNAVSMSSSNCNEVRNVLHAATFSLFSKLIAVSCKSNFLILQFSQLCDTPVCCPYESSITQMYCKSYRYPLSIAKEAFSNL